MAAHFGVTPVQVLRDVDTLWMSGTPGYFPDDLIDFDADSLDQRRAAADAVPWDGPRSAAGHPGGRRTGRRAARARRVGGRRAGPRRAGRARLDPRGADHGDRGGRGDGRRAARASRATPRWSPRCARRCARAAGCTCATSTPRTATTEREVDPWQLVTGDERSYLQAWCHASGGERLFRLDRILAAEVLDAPVTTQRRPVADGRRTGRPASTARSRLSLDGRARWAAEQLPTESVVDDRRRASRWSCGWPPRRGCGPWCCGSRRSCETSTRRGRARTPAQAAARALDAYRTLEPTAADARPAGGRLAWARALVRALDGARGRRRWSAGSSCCATCTARARPWWPSSERAAELVERLEERDGRARRRGRGRAPGRAGHDRRPGAGPGGSGPRPREVGGGRRARRDARREATYRRWLSFSR